MEISEEFLKGEIREGFYVETMMKKVWAAQLEVLGVVDRLCKKHNIQYGGHCLVQFDIKGLFLGMMIWI